MQSDLAEMILETKVSCSLGVVQAPTREKMAEAWDSGFRWDVAPPRSVRISERTDRGFAVTWDVPESGEACLSGYVVTVKEERGRRERRSLKVGKEDGRRVTFSDLSPCTSYDVEVSSYLAIDVHRSFEGSVASSSAIASTRRDEGEQFRLTSLSARSGRTSVTLSWQTGEWEACLGQLGVKLCRRGQDDNVNRSCSEPSMTRVLGERAVATFQHLEACATYKVRKKVDFTIMFFCAYSMHSSRVCRVECVCVVSNSRIRSRRVDPCGLCFIASYLCLARFGDFADLPYLPRPPHSLFVPRPPHSYPKKEDEKRLSRCLSK